MAKKRSKAKKANRPGYILVDNKTGYRFAAVYQVIEVDGKKLRKKFTRRIPDDASESAAWSIVEDLAQDIASKKDLDLPAAPTVDHTKRLNIHTLTLAQLGEWFKANYLTEPKFNDETRTQDSGSLTWQDRRRKINFVISRLGPSLRVRDLTFQAINSFKTTRLNEPVIVTKKKRDKHGKVIKPVTYVEVPHKRKFASVRLELCELRFMLNQIADDPFYKFVSPFRKTLTKGDTDQRDLIINQAQENALLSQCGDLGNAKSSEPRRRHLLLYLAVKFDSACRSAELRRLKVKDVNFETNEFSVYSFKGGRRTERVIPITPRARIALHEACNPAAGPGKTPDDYVFTYNVRVHDSKTCTLGCDQLKRKRRKTCTAYRIEYRFINAAPKRSLKTAKELVKETSNGAINLDGFRDHDGRHTTITRLVDSGLSPAEIMKVTGHTQLKTFMRYYNPDQAMRAGIANALHNYKDPSA